MSKIIPSSELAARLDDVRGRIAAAAVKSGRTAADVTLMAVTKAAAPEQIKELLTMGVTDLGENRVQQLQQRAAQINEFLARQQQRGEGGVGGMPARVRWHMIGHLQRNKVKPLLPIAACIHSIDSLRLAEEIDLQASKMPTPAGAAPVPGGTGVRIPVLLQVNASEEPQKYGVAVGAAVHLGEQIASMPNLALVGLMSMAALDATEKQARFTFSRTREIFEEMKWHKIGAGGFRHLSMGMSGDFEMAVEEGATIVRIGSSLFGTSTHGPDDDESGSED